MSEFNLNPESYPESNKAELFDKLIGEMNKIDSETSIALDELESMRPNVLEDIEMLIEYRTTAAKLFGMETVINRLGSIVLNPSSDQSQSV